jgi:hypothetical protein
MRLPIFLALICTACATTYSPQEGVTPAAQPAGTVVESVTIPTELTTIHPAFITAWTGHDPNAFEVYFTPTTTLTTPVGTFTGWTDINTKYFTTLLPNLSNYSATPRGFTRSGDMIVENGTYTYALANGGTTSNVTGTYTYNWMKQPDGTWRLMSVTIK